MIYFLIGLLVGIFIGAMLMCLMRVATINDLLNRNEELEHINRNLEEALERRTLKLNEEKQELINIMREKNFRRKNE